MFGATLVISPEHSIVEKITSDAYKDEIGKYILTSSRKSDLQRTDLNKNKTGTFTGAFAINPVNNKKIPIWIGDYVLTSYGTGAIMAVPGHDERDYEFAKKYSLDIRQVVDGDNVNLDEEAFTEDGVAVNSDFINGLNTEHAKSKMIDYIEKNNFGKAQTNFKLKDWLFPGRYWGTPIPIVYDPQGKPHPIPENTSLGIYRMMLNISLKEPHH